MLMSRVTMRLLKMIEIKYEGAWISELLFERVTKPHPYWILAWERNTFYFLDGVSNMWEFIYSVQFSSVTQSCPTLCNPMNCSTPGLPLHHQLMDFTQTLVQRVGDTIQTSHPLPSPSPLAPNPSQHQSLFQWVNSSHEVAKVLEFQL